MKNKKKLDDVTKAKLIYSGELLIFAIIFIVIGVLMLCNVWVLSDRFMTVFKILTIIGNTLLIGDFIWILCSPKRRKKNSLLDKFTILPANLYIIVLDILLLVNIKAIYDYRNLFIPPVFIYFGLVYIFQCFYHYKYPVPGLIDVINDEFSLKALNIEDADKEYAFLHSIEPENGFENPIHEMEIAEFKESYLPKLIDSSKGINIAKGRVPDTWFILYLENNPIGVFKVRHYLNKFLREGSGHIGYAIAKEFRGKGYAKIGLKLAINELQNMPDFKEDEVYMSCDKTNQASLKTMLANGAYIHHEDDKEFYTRIKIK